jgi:hypothetical protein
MNEMMSSGNWRIEANCCLTMCDKCLGKEKVRIVVSDNNSEKYARFVASKFAEYQAKAVQS